MKFIKPQYMFLAFGFLISACAPPKLSVNVDADSTTLDLSKVSRYRIVVRQWCDPSPAVAQDVAPASNFDVSTAVIPGEAFYVWVQAWQACANPPNVCPDDVLAADDECRCVDASPRYQKVIAEGCTPWVTLAEGADTIDITLAAPATGCPPQVNMDCP